MEDILREEIAKLKTEVISLKYQANPKLYEEVFDLKEKNAKFQKSNEEMAKKLSKLESERASVIREYEQEMKELKQELNDLKQENEEISTLATKEMKDLLDKFKTHKEKAEEQKRMNSVLQKQVEALKREATCTPRKTIENQRLDALKEISNLTNELIKKEDEKRRLIVNHEQVLFDASEREEKLKRVIETLQSHLKKLKTKLEQACQAYSQAKDEIFKKENDIKDLNMDIDELRTANREAEGRIESFLELLKSYDKVGQQALMFPSFSPPKEENIVVVEQQQQQLQQQASLLSTPISTMLTGSLEKLSALRQRNSSKDDSSSPTLSDSTTIKRPRNIFEELDSNNLSGSATKKKNNSNQSKSAEESMIKEEDTDENKNNVNDSIVSLEPKKRPTIILPGGSRSLLASFASGKGGQYKAPKLRDSFA